MNFRKFVDLFKPNNSDHTKKYVPILWEDDYCQIELIPQENMAFAAEQIRQTELFAEKHTTGVGYTSVFMREENAVPTLLKKIRSAYFREAIVSCKLPELIEMRYEGGEKKRIKASGSQIFGFPCFTLFFDAKDEFVKNIWVRFNLITSSDEFDLTLSSLYNLGEENDLILVDWNDSQIVDLKNRDRIKEYLMGWWK